MSSPTPVPAVEARSSQGERKQHRDGGGLQETQERSQPEEVGEQSNTHTVIHAQNEPIDPHGSRSQIFRDLCAKLERRLMEGDMGPFPPSTLEDLGLDLPEDPKETEDYMRHIRTFQSRRWGNRKVQNWADYYTGYWDGLRAGRNESTQGRATENPNSELEPLLPAADGSVGVSGIKPKGARAENVLIDIDDEDEDNDVDDC